MKTKYRMVSQTVVFCKHPHEGTPYGCGCTTCRFSLPMGECAVAFSVKTGDRITIAVEREEKTK